MNASPNDSGKMAFLGASEPGVSTGFLSRVLAPVFHKILDQIDRGLDEGMIEGLLPDGSRRILGGRGPGPVAEVHLKNWRTLWRVANGGTVGLYQGWAAGEWESADAVQLFDLFVRNRKAMGRMARPKRTARLLGWLKHRMRSNSLKGARRNIEFHYDLGNDFYSLWLDETMSYSSAMFAGKADSLACAQQRKIETLLARLNLNDGAKLLEIGCGWAGLAEVALAKADIDYHGITLSSEQKHYAEARIAAGNGASGNATFSLTDYRDVAGQYDTIASVEMVEAVGQEYWPDFLDCVANNLKPGGRAALQYIRIEDDIFEQYAASADFIQTYIFPGGMLLSESRFRALAEERGLAWQDQYDFGLDYAETLNRWRKSFDEAVDAGKLPEQFDEKFVGLWRFYLMYCEGGFRGGGINVSQVTLVKQD